MMPLRSREAKLGRAFGTPADITADARSAPAESGAPQAGGGNEDGGSG